MTLVVISHSRFLVKVCAGMKFSNKYSQFISYLITTGCVLGVKRTHGAVITESIW